MRLIGINGYAKSGKDTVGKLIQCHSSPGGWFKAFPHIVVTEWDGLYDDISKWRIKKYAYKLKKIASLLTGIPINKFEDQQFKEKSLGPEWGNMSVREFLQKLGTECMRNGLHEDVWGNALFSEWDNHQYWLITDTRFENEAQRIKDLGGIVINVKRPGIFPINLHPSETSLDEWNFDYVIENDGSIEDLSEKVKVFLTKYNII